MVATSGSAVTLGYPAREKRSALWRAALAVPLAIGGVTLLSSGMSGLRPAYLYRERTNEGVMFFGVALLLTAGDVLTLLAAALLLWASRTTNRRPAMALKAAAACLAAGVAACAAVSTWVVDQSGCIGRCG